mgnify:CR=1 FL=1
MEVYKATILQAKHGDFLNFLESLGVHKEDFKLSYVRGDYFIFELNISNEDIRKKINSHQVDFL